MAWDRVAGGEVALKKRLQGRLPLDSDDFLRLGSADDAPRVHVGAYVDQQPLIDAVVNETWIDTLGMKRDNAMLVRTGGTAPDRVQDRLTDVLGKDAAVTPVDKASRIGLDPNTAQVAVVTGTVADAVGVFRYTVIGGGRIAPEPAWVSSHISTEAVPILGSMTCNTLMFPQLKAALQEIVDRGLASEIHPDEYAGCYYPRFIAGSTTLSNHSFGLAFDINVPGNGRGTVGAINRDVVQIFKDWGFDWGGDWSYTDPMHFEMAQIVTPGGAAARSD
ncbi:M15 family metallopeptidase [Nocardioides flavescens]|uniref:M15 family metallopeptidase n=1 Tax=Nocardioides flavescens TaxID=2691959 RepID=UPI00301D1438